jgi:hypothetical protein
MPCIMYISGMKLTLGRHDLAHDLYVMDLPDINIIPQYKHHPWSSVA